MPDYTPSVYDILRCGHKSCNKLHSTCSVDGIHFQVIDTSGLQITSKKWFSCFEDVHLIIFCVSMNDYDQVLVREDLNICAMDEYISFFNNICNSQWFTKTAIMLFLNKADLFKEKLCSRYIDLRVAFPEYTGGFNFENANDYIIKKFRCVDKSEPVRMFYSNSLCATDIDCVVRSYQSIRDLVVHAVLQKAGLL